MKQYKEVLLLNSSEIELFKFKHQMDMFGVAEHIHTETNGVSAMYYLRNVVRLPELVIANLGKGDETVVDFINELERFLKNENKYSTIFLMYDTTEKEFKRLQQYRQFKNPLCVPELFDDNDWLKELLN